MGLLLMAKTERRYDPHYTERRECRYCAVLRSLADKDLI
jgi:hypothetical protein